MTTSEAARIGGPKPTSRLIIRPDPLNELGIVAAWVGSGQSYTLHWGDGTEPTPMTPFRPPARHLYASAGRYLVRGVTVDNQYSIEGWVEVPWPKPGPKISFRGGRLSVGVKWPAAMPKGTWRVHWPDWEPEDIEDPDPDVWVDRPCLPGAHTITVDTPEGSSITSPTLTVTDKWRSSVTADIVTQGRTVSIRRTGPADPDDGVAGRPWWVFWGDEWHLGDNSIARQSTPLRNDEAAHTYTEPGVYQLEIASSWRGLVYVAVWEVTIA